MKNKTVSIKDVFNKSMSYLGKNWQKAFLSSLLQFGVFLIVYLITKTFIVSFVSWLLFLPTQTIFLSHMDDKNVKLEHTFKIGSNWVTYILLAILSAICYTIGVVFVIVPAIILFINFVFVFEFAKENDLFESLKKSAQTAKGYRSKILTISLIYLFILIVLIAVSILFAMLIGYWLSTTSFMVYVWGTFAGFSLFLILVAPVMTLTITYLKNSIEQDKLLQNQQVDEKDNDDTKILDDQQYQQNDMQIENSNFERNTNLCDTIDQDEGPTDLIV